MTSNQRLLRSFRNPLFLFVAMIVVWQIIPTTLKIPAYVLPTLSDVLIVFKEKWPYLLQQTFPTFVEMIVGLAFSIIVGVGFGVAIGQFTIVRETLYPLLIVLNCIPKIALAPLIIIWVGFGLTSILAIVVLISFFPILINTIVGVANVRPEMVELVRTMTPSRSKEFLHVRVPSAIPYIFAGMRTSATLVGVGAVVAEFIVGQAGLGFVILSAQQSLNVAMIFSAIIILAIVSLIVFGALVLIEKRLMPWRNNLQVL